MKNFVSHFTQQFGAALALDWIAICAASIGLALMAAYSISNAAVMTSDNLSKYVSTQVSIFPNQ